MARAAKPARILNINIPKTFCLLYQCLDISDLTDFFFSKAFPQINKRGPNIFCVLHWRTNFSESSEQNFRESCWTHCKTDAATALTTDSRLSKGNSLTDHKSDTFRLCILFFIKTQPATLQVKTWPGDQLKCYFMPSQPSPATSWRQLSKTPMRWSAEAWVTSKV